MRSRLQAGASGQAQARYGVRPGQVAVRQCQVLRGQDPGWPQPRMFLIDVETNLK
jgi:hypothetical protein